MRLNLIDLKFDQACLTLENAQKILILVHQDPDGDTIASSLALKIGLESAGKHVSVVGKDKIPKTFEFLPKVRTIRQDFLLGDFEAICVVDCGDLKRTGFPVRLRNFAKTKKKLINIDHHPRNDLHKLANINIFDPEASAAGELVHKLLSKMNIPISPEIAQCLLTALYTDTGGFRHSNTSSPTLALASKLMSLGARPSQITQQFNNHKSLATLKLWGIALERIKRDDQLGLTISVIFQDDIASCRAGAQDLAGVVNLISSVPGTKAAILLTELDNGCVKASLRTEDNSVDVSKIAAIMGGGGHKKASGFTISAKILSNGSGGWKIN